VSGFLSFENVTKSFGTLRAVDGVTLDIARGEVFSLLGPSGCGKTTLLRLAAGFETPDQGRILLDGRDITALPPEKRPVNTVFQNYALFPHLSVADNIAFGPRVARRSKAEVAREVEAMLDLVRLRDHAARKPAQLSGGQKQRVAIARALVNKPQVLLLDEPLAALDLKLRQHMLGELRAIHEAAGVTFVYVTHDQTEAMGLSDRIAVMHAGRIEQLGPPAEVYDKPRTRFVAGFIGDANCLGGTVTPASPPPFCAVDVPGVGRVLSSAAPALPAGTRVEIVIRPERIRVMELSPDGAVGLNAFHAVVEDLIPLGAMTRCVARVGSTRFTAEQPGRTPRPGIVKGSSVTLHFDSADVAVMPVEEGGL
jgi:spermidine/putrescine transport system ATP-binding protein